MAHIRQRSHTQDRCSGLDIVYCLKGSALHRNKAVNNLFISVVFFSHRFSFPRKKSGDVKNPASYLHVVQGLAVLQPAIRGFGFGIGFAFPHQRVVDGRLHILGPLGQLRRGCGQTDGVTYGNTLQPHQRASL